MHKQSQRRTDNIRTNNNGTITNMGTMNLPPTPTAISSYANTNRFIARGVLLKRREYFTKQWRQRYFVLEGENGLFNYYDPAEPISADINSNTSYEIETRAISTSGFSSSFNLLSSSSSGLPKGSIFLPGCGTYPNDKLSNPSRNFYAFTIVQYRNANISEIHLATTSVQMRVKWMSYIEAASGTQLEDAEDGSTISSNPVANEQLLSSSTPPRSLSPVQEVGKYESSNLDKGSRPPSLLNVTSSTISCSTSETPASASIANDAFVIGDPVLYRKRNYNVPPELAKKNELVTRRLLDFADESHSLWTPMFEKEGLKAMKKPNVWATNKNDAAIVRSELIVNNHPRQVLNLLADMSRATEYKETIREAYTVKIYNEQSFLQYNAVKAFMPFYSRDMCTFSQVRVYPCSSKQSNVRIVYTYFTTPGLEQIYPVKPNHVRAKMPFGGIVIESLGGNKCLLKRFLAFDFVGENGSVPLAVQNIVEKGNGGMLLGLAKGLKKHDPTPPARLTAENVRPMTEEAIIEDVLCRTPNIHKFLSNAGKNSSTCSSTIPKEILVSSDENCTSSIIRDLSYPSAKGKKSFLFKVGASQLISEQIQVLMKSSKGVLNEIYSERSISVAVCLVLLIYPEELMMETNLVGNKFLESALIILLLVRTLLLAYISPSIKCSQEQFPGLDNHQSNVTGVVTCRINVDVAMILQYIRKCSTSSMQSSDPCVSATHIVVKAVAKALSETSSLNGRNVRIPFLGIKGFYANRGLDVLMAVVGPDKQAQTSFKLKNVNDLSLEVIARQTSVGNASHCGITMKLIYFMFGHFLNCVSHVLDSGLANFYSWNANCVVLSCANSSKNNTAHLDVVPNFSGAGSPTVLVTIGGVRSVSKHEEDMHVHDDPRHELPISIVIDCPVCSVDTCRGFATRIEELVQFPDRL
mmetsp:Transcript_38093/g.46025  ORF Transcript_38093/g.46025 Transcript_38093/m.46025 type:complete len:922 (-) Transcript_38093:97-2862(-)